MLWKYHNESDWKVPRSSCEDVYLLPAGKVGNPDEESLWLIVSSMAWVDESIQHQKDCAYILENYSDESLRYFQDIKEKLSVVPWYTSSHDETQIYVAVEDFTKKELQKYVEVWLKENYVEEYSGLIEAGASEFYGTDPNQENIDIAQERLEDYQKNPEDFTTTTLAEFLQLTPEELERFEEVAERKKKARKPRDGET